MIFFTHIANEINMLPRVHAQINLDLNCHDRVFMPAQEDKGGWNETWGSVVYLICLLRSVVHDSEQEEFLIISSCSRLDGPESTHENVVWARTLLHFVSIAHWALLSNTTFKGPDRERLGNFTLQWNETSWWANLLSALRLSAAAAAAAVGGKNPLSPLYKATSGS